MFFALYAIIGGRTEGSCVGDEPQQPAGKAAKSMLIAQTSVEYGLLPAIGNAMFTLRVGLEELIGPPGLTWVGIALAIVGVLWFIRR
jgi:hypothetical protein